MKQTFVSGMARETSGNKCKKVTDVRYIYDESYYNFPKYFYGARRWGRWRLENCFNKNNRNNADWSLTNYIKGKKFR